jgi:hypothetical protein
MKSYKLKQNILKRMEQHSLYFVIDYRGHHLREIPMYNATLVILHKNFYFNETNWTLQKSLNMNKFLRKVI